MNKDLARFERNEARLWEKVNNILVEHDALVKLLGVGFRADEWGKKIAGWLSQDKKEKD